MQYIHHNNTVVELDDEGFLVQVDSWNITIAELLAKQDSFTLTNEHIAIIQYAHDFYQEYKTSPNIRMLIKFIADVVDIDKANSRYLQNLFPNGPAILISKYAGLPKPVKCL